MLNEVHESHHYYKDHFVDNFTPDKPRKFMSVVRKEMLLLRSSLPPGIFIRGFENAMVSLYIVMVMMMFDNGGDNGDDGVGGDDHDDDGSDNSCGGDGDIGDDDVGDDGDDNGDSVVTMFFFYRNCSPSLSWVPKTLPMKVESFCLISNYHLTTLPPLPWCSSFP